MYREIITIDEDKCDGCGLCVPACEEGAIRIVNGKAKLVEDRLCDGMGACLGHCPQGAIKIERREAESFDAFAVAKHLAREPAASRRADAKPAAPDSRPATQAGERHSAGGCPGSRFALFAGPGRTPAPCSTATTGPRAESESALSHWPVQLRLLPAAAPVLEGAHILVAADCVPVAYPGFHAELLSGRAVVIACPKLDDPRGYVEKLAEMLSRNAPASVTVARMEVPCCMGIVQMVLAAREMAECDVEVEEIVVGVRGQLLGRRRYPVDGPVTPVTGCGT